VPFIAGYGPVAGMIMSCSCTSRVELHTPRIEKLLHRKAAREGTDHGPVFRGDIVQVVRGSEPARPCHVLDDR
jgi:hypothetical protein